jgi:hypothetical protein
VTIDVSIGLDGAGAGETTITGGGPVLTVGVFGAASEPTVSIDGVTLTGGVTRSSPVSRPFVGEEGVIAAGGGIEIPPNADFTGGATMTIRNSVITGNRVAPTTTLPIGPPCPKGPCPFARATGGGIDSWGTVTLDHSTVSNNRVGSASGLSNLASDAYAGGIQIWQGSLTITDSVVSGNQVSASAPNGRDADSGAIFLEGGTLTMTSSWVTNNSATLNAAMPSSVDTGANSGGIHISDQASGSIRTTTISGNAVVMTNTLGDAQAQTGGVETDGNIIGLTDDVIVGNSVTVSALGRSGGNAGADSGAGELDATVVHTRFANNSVSASSVAGDANADAGVSVFAGSIDDSIITGNHVAASSPRGTASDVGGALVAGDFGITLRNTIVSRNTANPRGRHGFAQGGGILDVDQSPDGPPGGPLILIATSITGNTLMGSAGFSLQGGGVYATNPVSLFGSVIANNVPDQCFGC